ncbi:MAG: hypothetical protein KBA14_05690 [Saprospiraceae bacterium]|nr:hypothetical protein [Saprospiraceae bacterium]
MNYTMGKGLILVILLFGMLGGFASCKKETQLDMLMHTWKVDDWVVAPGMNLSDSMKNEMIKSATMEFKADSTFIFKGMNPKPTTGKYYLSIEAQLLTLIPEGSLDSYGHSVKVLTKNKLVLEDSSGNKLSCSH